MSDSQIENLGVRFPESLKVKYYQEGIAWLEQNAKLIAEVNKDDLPEITDTFKESKSHNAESKFWYIHYKFNKNSTAYSYSGYNSSGAVTADTLVVPHGRNKVKLYMDITYW